VSSEQVAQPGPGEDVEAQPVTAPRGTRRNLVLFLGAVVVLNVVAFILVPPFPAGEPGKPVTGISDLITANLEFPAPHVLIDLAPDSAVPAGTILSFHPSITNTLFTMWCVMAVVLLIAFLGTRRLAMLPGRYQNLLEFTWESLENWATSLGGSAAAKHIPLFVAFFLLILFSNWSGLLPFFGKLEAFRAPTSDLNVTIGLALVAFLYFHFRGFQALGVRGYLGKFFVFSGFRHGIANGVIDLFVGLIEFMLEFIKPVTLAMRLFGNIYGGEVALGVITALTFVLVPVAMISLEVLLNLIQALIFSTLMLMYTLIAVEGHHADEEPGEEKVEATKHGAGTGAAVATAATH
jgi:F-type H+-transporting ATPase subunit a